MKRIKILTILETLFMLLLIAFASASGLSAVLAKNINVPSDTTIFYWSGANTTINVPATFHWPTAKISIVAYDNTGGNVGTGDTLLLSLSVPVSGVFVTFPWAIITDNSEAAEVQRLAFSGTPVYIQKTVSGVTRTLDNVFPVKDGELEVDRHGNSITVDFNPDPALPITLQFPSTPFWPTPNVAYPLVLPAFHLEVEKYGGSTHFEASRTFTSSIPGVVLSGYTISTDQMGFSADATFTCPSWPIPVNMQTASDAFVTMHGINTVIPP